MPTLAHTANIERNRTISEALSALGRLGECRRIGRASERPVHDLTVTSTDDGGSIIVGRILSADGVAIHHPRINVTQNGRSFRCSCEDHQFRARQVGPCKHVLSLSMAVFLA